MMRKINILIIIFICLLLVGCSPQRKTKVTNSEEITNNRNPSISSQSNIQPTISPDKKETSDESLPRLFKTTMNNMNFIYRYQKSATKIRKYPLQPGISNDVRYICLGNRDSEPLITVTIDGKEKDLLRDTDISDSDFVDKNKGYVIKEGTIIQVDYFDLGNDGVNELIIALGDGKSLFNLYVYTQVENVMNIWCSSIISGVSDAFILEDRIITSTDMYGTYHEILLGSSSQPVTSDGETSTNQPKEQFITGSDDDLFNEDKLMEVFEKAMIYAINNDIKSADKLTMRGYDSKESEEEWNFVMKNYFKDASLDFIQQCLIEDSTLFQPIYDYGSFVVYDIDGDEREVSFMLIDNEWRIWRIGDIFFSR